jgi:hypothetical protein
MECGEDEGERGKEGEGLERSRFASAAKNGKKDMPSSLSAALERVLSGCFSCSCLQRGGANAFSALVALNERTRARKRQ